MPKIGTWDLSETAIAAVRELIDELGNADLMSYKGDFKSCTKPAQIQQQLKKKVIPKGDVRISEFAVSFLKRHLKCYQFTSLFSTTGIEKNNDSICAYFGQGNFELALALEDRPNVRKVFVNRLPVVTPVKVDRIQLRDELIRSVEKTFSRSLNMEGGSEQKVATIDKQPKRKSSGDLLIVSEETGLTKVRKKHDLPHAEQREKKEKWEAELAQAKSNITMQNVKILESERLLREKAEQLRLCQENQAATIAAAVAEQVSSTLRPWLQEPLACQKLVVGFPREFETLKEMVDDAIKVQAERDKHTGNKLRIEAQVQELEKLRDQLVSARCSALYPHPDLRTVIELVEGEISQRNKRLGRAESADPLRDGLVSEMNSAKDDLEIDRISRLIDELATRGILKPHAKTVIVEAKQRRLSMLREPVRPSRQVDPKAALRKALDKNEKTMLIVDGHNVLHGLPEVFGEVNEDGVSHKPSRDLLVEKVQIVLNNSPNVHGLIMFDGPIATKEVVAKNLVVEFSGGDTYTDGRADDAIIMHLEKKNSSAPDLPKFVISDDLGLQERVKLRDKCYAIDLISFKSIFAF